MSDESSVTTKNDKTALLKKLAKMLDKHTIRVGYFDSASANVAFNEEFGDPITNTLANHFFSDAIKSSAKSNNTIVSRALKNILNVDASVVDRVLEDIGDNTIKITQGNISDTMPDILKDNLNKEIE